MPGRFAASASPEGADPRCDGRVWLLRDTGLAVSRVSRFER